MIDIVLSMDFDMKNVFHRDVNKSARADSLVEDHDSSMIQAKKRFEPFLARTEPKLNRKIEALLVL